MLVLVFFLLCMAIFECVHDFTPLIYFSGVCTDEVPKETGKEDKYSSGCFSQN